MTTNEFRSLLSNFEEATGSNNNGEEPTTKHREETLPKKQSLFQMTTKLWQLTQLKHCTTAKKSDTTRTEKSQHVHLATCLCIVDALPHEEIWKHWMNHHPTNDNVSAELYIHAKHPERIKSSWAKSKLLSVSYQPNWNDVRIVRAMLKLGETALQQQRTTHVVFGTESCIPICPLQDVQIDVDTSYVKCFDSHNVTRFDELRIWQVLKTSLPSDSIYKALPGWCCLSRKHMQAILDLPAQHLQGQPLWPAFEQVWAPEEVYFPTCLALLGLLSGEETNTCRSLTYSEWDHRAQCQQDRAHPKTFDREFSANLVQSLRRDGCFFLRKIKHRMPLRRWQQVVERTHASFTRQERVGEKRKAHGGEHDERDWRRYNRDGQRPRQRHRRDNGRYRHRR